MESKVTITSLSCHTCGAPNRVNTDRFHCAYCGATNVVTFAVQAFYRRATVHYSGPHDLLSLVTALAHAIERIRTFTSGQMKSVRDDLVSLQERECTIEQKLADAHSAKHGAFRSLKDSLGQILFGVFVVPFIGCFIVFAYYAYRIIHHIVAWFSEGASLLVDGIAFFLASTTAVALVCAAARPFRDAVSAARKMKQEHTAIPTIRVQLEMQKRQHNTQGREVIDKHSQLIGAIRTFLKARASYEARKDEIPIGIQMDEALSSLNDMTFGNVINTLKECFEIVDVFEARPGVVAGTQ